VAEPASNGAQAPVITVEDLGRAIEAARGEERACRQTIRNAEAQLKAAREELYPLVAMKKRLTSSTEQSA
jgi:phage shock protein A